MAEQVVNICVNAKTSYPGGAVCNAVEHLLFQKDAAARLLPKVSRPWPMRKWKFAAMNGAGDLFPSAKPATANDWDTEYLAFVVGVKVDGFA